MDKISKESESKATITGQRVSFDISSVNKTCYCGNKFWLLVVDEFTNYCWSIFLKNKSNLPEAMMNWLNNFQREHKINVQHFRCDNSGENKKFQELVKTKTKMNIVFEFTAPNTPQQNGKVERKFANLYGKI